MNDHSDSQLLRSIDTKVTQISTALFGLPGDDGFIQTTKDHIQSHSDRIRKIERWMYTVIGAVVVLAFLIGHNMISVAAMAK